MSTIKKPLVLAHRGASGYAPENTMEAFRLAAEMGADGIETDVRFSKDKQIIIIHDEKIDRVSNGQGVVGDYTLDELKFFDFGYKFKNQLTGTKIPTLAELLEFLKTNDLYLNIEVKSTDADMPKALVDLVEEYGLSDRVVYSSFNHLQMARILEYKPDAIVGTLYSFNMMKPWDYCENMGARASHPNHAQLDLFPEYVEECHKRGIRVNTWTCDDPTRIGELVDLGVDAIISNVPDVALGVVAEKLK